MLKNFLNKIIQATWNIAIAQIGEDLTPINIKWIKHNYHDRWFADPFFLEENSENYVILAEELTRCNDKGRICKLTIDKKDCKLLKNETLLDLQTHLSFPNVFRLDGNTYVYPENSASGYLTLYRMSGCDLVKNTRIPKPMIDPVFFKIDEGVLLLGTLPEDANGNVLHVYKSDHLLGSFEEIQQITFNDNIARRAGNVFEWKGRIIAPGQVCNDYYGEGISLQEIKFANDGSLIMNEIKRLKASEVTKMTGFHTYNIIGNRVVIDGYHFGNKFIHDLYFKLRGLKNM